jgi:hypothetical protein
MGKKESYLEPASQQRLSNSMEFYSDREKEELII